MATKDGQKVGRNEGCPCGSGEKYKNCCLPKGIRWSELLQFGVSATFEYLCARGKNIQFYELLFGLLQIDPERGAPSLEQIKAGFSPATVQKLYQGVGELWPNARDLRRVLSDEKQRTSGLYIGRYDQLTVVQGVKRHALYSDTILLVDPFMHPLRFNDELNPILHPEKHRSNALKAALIWLELFPWVMSGMVRFVRTPADYDRGLLLRTIDSSERRNKDHPELEELLNKEFDEELSGPPTDFFKFNFLHASDETLYRDFIKSPLGNSDFSFDEFRQQLSAMRAAHPYYLDWTQRGEKIEEFIGFSTGANYDLAKHMASLSGSHLITDIPYRWREIELDRESANIDEQGWSPLAKALGNVKLSYLKDVPLQAAFELRQKGRLEHMRNFFRKIWKSASSSQPFDPANAANLAAELDERVREAKGEFDKIKQDLTTWLGATAAASLSSAWLAPASMGIVSAATGIIGGVASLAKAQMSRTAVEEKFPASFFLKLKAK